MDSKFIEAKCLVEHQLNIFFPHDKAIVVRDEYLINALEQTSDCVSKLKAWHTKGFDCEISWMYATFLYNLSRELFLKDRNKKLATKLFLLNKYLHGIELYFEVDLPKYFFLSHTNSLVFSKATYGQFCVFHQNCTIGRNLDNKPVLENLVVMYPGSQIIGRCHIRENTVIRPGVSIVNRDTPGNCIVQLAPNGGLEFKEIHERHAERFFLDITCV